MLYNGHKNWTHWNVSLWLRNDDALYRTMRECIGLNDNKDLAARDLLARLPEKTPDGAKYSYSAVRVALVGE